MSSKFTKNMETIYWTCGGVANMVKIIIVGLNSFFLGSHNSQEVTLPRKSQLPCAITFSSSHYPPLHLDWPHAPKKVDPSNYTGPMPPKSFKPGYRSKWQFCRKFWENLYYDQGTPVVIWNRYYMVIFPNLTLAELKPGHHCDICQII